MVGFDGFDDRLDYSIENVITQLRRFPQHAALCLVGDRGMEDLRVYAPIGRYYTEAEVGKQFAGCEIWEHFRLDAEDRELPWLKATIGGDR